MSSQADIEVRTVTATTGFSITVKGAIQIIAAFIHAGNPMYVFHSIHKRAENADGA